MLEKMKVRAEDIKVKCRLQTKPAVQTICSFTIVFITIYFFFLTPQGNLQNNRQLFALLFPRVFNTRGVFCGGLHLHGLTSLVNPVALFAPTSNYTK